MFLCARGSSGTLPEKKYETTRMQRRDRKYTSDVAARLQGMSTAENQTVEAGTKQDILGSSQYAQQQSLMLWRTFFFSQNAVIVIFELLVSQDHRTFVG